jgi:hypothetical protein
VVAGIMAVVIGGSIVLFSANPEDTFVWGGTIGTLILLVAYLLTTIGAIRLIFIQRKMDVPSWQIVIPLAAIVLLGYTLYRNVIPYPPSGSAAHWLPIVSGGWLLIGIIAIIVAPAATQRMGIKLTEMDGIAAAKASNPTGPPSDSSILLEGGAG